MFDYWHMITYDYYEHTVIVRKDRGVGDVTVVLCFLFVNVVHTVWSNVLEILL